MFKRFFFDTRCLFEWKLDKYRIPRKVTQTFYTRKLTFLILEEPIPILISSKFSSKMPCYNIAGYSNHDRTIFFKPFSITLLQ